jgi:outer membrane receptor protein involved in Fe transport
MRAHRVPALAVVLLLVRAAAAQEPEPITRLPEIRVTAPSPPGALLGTSTPARVDRLGEEDLRGAHPTTLPDVLERLPGVTLQNEQGNRFQPDVSLRGFSASPVTGLPQGFSVFLDGVRLNEPTVEEVNFDLIPLEDVERIEVIRGPSVLFGRNTLGGAINLVTRRGREAREIVPELATGSFGRRDLRLRLGGASRPVDWALSLTDVRDDGYRDFASGRVSRAFGKVGVDLGGTDLTLSYQYANNRISQAGSLPESEALRHPRRNFTAGDFFAPELHMATLSGEHRIDERLTLAVNAFVRSLETEQFNVNLIADNNRLLNHTLSAGGTVQATHTGTLADRRNVLIAGAEYARHDVRSRTFEEPASGPILQADLADTQDAVGVYAQDALTLVRDLLVPGSTLVLTVAARWDWLRHDITDRLGGPSSGVHDYDRVNPRAGLTLTLSERLRVYASYAEGFRAPAFLELTCAGPGAVCPGLQAGVAPDPPLHAVTARSYELGVQARPFAWLDVDLSGFRTDVSDDIFSVAPTGTTGVFFQNVGSTRREGVELGLRVRPMPEVEAFLNYAFTRATFQEGVELATPLPPGQQTVRPGDSLALVPRHRLNAGVLYRPWPWLTLSADARYVGSQVLRGDEANRHAELPAYWVANVGASVKLRGVETFIRLNNVLDDRHATFGTFAVNGREAGQPVQRFLTPGLPFNVLAGVGYAF